MKVYYRLKEGMKQEIKKHTKFKVLAERIGIDESYISQIVNGRRLTISKTVAFAICKALSPDLEIQDIFDVSYE